MKEYPIVAREIKILPEHLSNENEKATTILQAIESCLYRMELDKSIKIKVIPIKSDDESQHGFLVYMSNGEVSHL
jgi:hypothetical protein